MSDSKTENEKLLDHEYDGIRELDNPLPGWWLATFYISIVFAIVYFAYYEIFGGPTLDQQLEARMENIAEMSESKQEPAESVSEDQYIAMLGDEEVVESGKTEFAVKCMACHGNNAQGIIGPNLTDDYWIWGNGSVSSIVKTINNGVPDKGMPAWDGLIKPEVIQNIAVYIYSLHGSNPPGAKPPQGEKVEY